MCDDDIMMMMMLIMVVRAARHGHQMTGKLARLAQQEADRSSTEMSQVSHVVSAAVTDGCQQEHDRSQKKKKKKKKKTRLKRTGTEQR